MSVNCQGYFEYTLAMIQAWYGKAPIYSPSLNLWEVLKVDYLRFQSAGFFATNLLCNRNTSSLFFRVM